MYYSSKTQNNIKHTSYKTFYKNSEVNFLTETKSMAYMVA